MTRRTTIAGLLLMIASAACSSADDAQGGDTTNTGGSSDSGGSVSTGGTGTGGSQSTGGAPGSGGAGGANSGGAIGTGGAKGTGGTAGAGGTAGTSGVDAGPPPADPCVLAGNCQADQWIDVTPSGIHLDITAQNDNFGVQDVLVDPMRPNVIYAFTCHQGVWKSTDYGQTWTGPINTGTNGSKLAAGKQWCGAIYNASPSTPPTLFTCNGNGQLGAWRSTDGGVSWENFQTLPSALGEDIYSIQIDPHDGTHLLTGFHESSGIAESTDSGQTWKNVSGNMTGGGSWYPHFIETGDDATTRKTWLALPQPTGGMVGTWRTADGGTTWKHVENVEHPHGDSQIYQQGGAIFLTGSYGTQGGGMYRSTDLGLTWSYLGNWGGAIVWGTAKTVYTMYGWPNTGPVDPAFAEAPAPGTSGWKKMTTPNAMDNGPKRVAITNDGTNNIFVGGMWQAGIWRYIESK